MSSPSISVVMPVYNNEQYLQESIESVLRQTYDNYEFIIINDGSTDSSKKIIEKFQQDDDRIILLTQKNLGITKSLNRAIKYSNGDYIARMDADDICDPKRFELQIQHMEKNPNIDIVGSMVSIISKKGEIIKFMNDLPIEDYQIKWQLIFGTPLIHPALLIKKSTFTRYGYFDDRLDVAQDIEFWRRISCRVRFYNLPKILLKLRIHNRSTSFLFQNEQDKVRHISLVQYVNKLTGPYYNNSKIALLIDFMKNGSSSVYQLQNAINILNRIRIVFINRKCRSSIQKRYINKSFSELFIKSALNTIKIDSYLSLLMLTLSVLINFRIIFYRKTYWYIKQGILKYLF